MAAENCSLFDPWMHHYSHEPWGLSVDLLDRENELLTRALQFSLYDPSMSTFPAAAGPFTPPESSSISGNSSAAVSAASGSSSSGLLLNHLAPAEALAMGGRRRGGPMAATGRVTKRKSRASKKRPTTYINADMANFREMVQRVTGVQVGAGGELGAAASTEPEEKTGTQRTASAAAAVRGRAGLMPELQQFRLPTLDTSEFFLERSGASPAAGDSSLGSGFDEALGGDFDFESSLLPVDFATFDSWAAMAMQ